MAFILVVHCSTLLGHIETIGIYGPRKHNKLKTRLLVILLRVELKIPSFELKASQTFSLANS